jgi:hypothetical protein
MGFAVHCRSGFGLNTFSDCERFYVLPNSMRLSMAAMKTHHRHIIDLKTGLTYSPIKLPAPAGMGVASLSRGETWRS